MSKFVDRLREAVNPIPPPMGFGKQLTSQKKARLVLIAALNGDDADGLKDVLGAADAALLPFDINPTAMASLSKTLKGIIWGQRLAANNDPPLAALAQNGGDFIVFRAEETGLSILESAKMGRILEVDARIEDTLLRAASALPVDGVMIRNEDRLRPYLTWRDLMVFRHCAELVNKPIIITLNTPLTEKELLVLWESGVDALLVAAGPGVAGDLLKKLRAVIDKIIFPAERRTRKREALVPPPPVETYAPEKEEEDGEEDE